MKSKEVLKPISKLLEPYGFQRKGTQFHRCPNDILQGIGFDFSEERGYCTVYIMPTFMPAECLYYTYGNRLEHITGHPLELEKDILETALPFFEESITPEKLYHLLCWNPGQVKKFFHCPPIQLQRLKLYTAVYMGKNITGPVRAMEREIVNCSFLSETVLKHYREETAFLKDASKENLREYFQKNAEQILK